MPQNLARVGLQEGEAIRWRDACCTSAVTRLPALDGEGRIRLIKPA